MNNLRATALAAAAALACGAANAQTSMAAAPSTAPLAPTAATVPAPAPAPAAAPTSGKVVLTEGTEIEIKMSEKLSSGTSQTGDRFSFNLAEPIDLGGGVVIPAGYHGRGTVTNAQKRGFIGKAGELNVTFDYIRVGNDRIRVRATKGGQGKGSLGAAVALTVLFGPLGLLARGADIVIPEGQMLTAYVDDNATLNLPFLPPPPSDD